MHCGYAVLVSGRRAACHSVPSVVMECGVWGEGELGEGPEWREWGVGSCELLAELRTEASCTCNLSAFMRAARAALQLVPSPFLRRLALSCCIKQRARLRLLCKVLTAIQPRRRDAIIPIPRAKGLALSCLACLVRAFRDNAFLSTRHKRIPISSLLDSAPTTPNLNSRVAKLTSTPSTHHQHTIDRSTG